MGSQYQNSNPVCHHKRSCQSHDNAITERNANALSNTKPNTVNLSTSGSPPPAFVRNVGIAVRMPISPPQVLLLTRARQIKNHGSTYTSSGDDKSDSRANDSVSEHNHQQTRW